MKQSLSYRKIFSKNLWLFLPLLFFFPAIISCGGDGLLAGGGIGGTGNTSVGPITALGSIFVNGIEFQTTSATVTINGVNSNEKELQVGMVVKVEGTVNADGKTGKADIVIFDHNAAGPIHSIDLDRSTLEVMGQTVFVDSQTIIVGLLSSSLGLADLATNDMVEISGLTDTDGNIKATRIAWQNADFPSEVSGRISSLTNTTFQINTLSVDYSNAMLSKFGSLGIQPGDYVAVRGHLTSPTTLLADLLEKKSPGFRNNDSMSIDGLIDRLFYSGKSISGFAINTQFGLQSVELNASTIFSTGQLNKIKVGARVKVLGTIGNNIIQAKQLETL
jgi:hypothetical protein